MLGSAVARAGWSRAHKFLLNIGLVGASADWRRRRELRLFCLTAITALGGCASGGAAPQTSMAPMFPESKWGVSASQRVASPSAPIPKGGGIYKVGDPYQVGGLWYDPREQPDYDRVGIASWYGTDFHARRTANGEVYDMNALTAAHPTLPMPSYAYVTNLSNGRTILVRINDRGPYVADRVIDLSQRSARELGLERGGTGRVRVKYAGRAPLDGNDVRERQFLANGSPVGGERVAHAGMSYQPTPTSQTYEPPRQAAYAQNEWAPSARAAAPPRPRTIRSQDWAPPPERATTSRTWAMNDSTAAAPRSYSSTLNWSPAAYRAGLVAR